MRPIYLNDNTPRKIIAYICNCAGKTIAGKLRRGGSERTREKRRKSERQCVVKNKFGVSHRFDHWSNFSGLRDG